MKEDNTKAEKTEANTKAEQVPAVQPQTPASNSQYNNKEKQVMDENDKNIQINAIEEVLTESDAISNDAGITRGLQNLASVTPFAEALPVNGMAEKSLGVIAFRRKNRNLNLAIACGTATTFYVPLRQFTLLIEHCDDPELRTVIMQNCSDNTEGDGARGQVLARLNFKHSAIHVIWGHHGKVISGKGEFAKQEVYYIPREMLLCFYLAAKAQAKGGDQLEEMISANEGWREYDIPTNPLDPGGK